MAYRVRFAKRALRDLDQIYGYIGAARSEAAHDWFEKLRERIAGLAIAPHGGAFTHESPDIRQMIYGNSPHFYRVLYRTNDRIQEVRVLSVRHGRRQEPRSPFA